MYCVIFIRPSIAVALWQANDATAVQKPSCVVGNRYEKTMATVTTQTVTTDTRWGIPYMQAFQKDVQK